MQPCWGPKLLDGNVQIAWLLLQGTSAFPDEDEEEEEGLRVITLPIQAHHAMEKMEEFVHKVTNIHP